MLFRVDFQSDVPIYKQIRDQVVLAVAGGLFSCAFQPLMATRGTMLFLPGV